ncbi:origin recognition complex subunit 3-like [Salvelinus alpinus]|uniref:origin recognition complex subunit 3-like n=1 Tax=Salvelinus alpinus TaxID=8036 RepID=UPI0039FBAA58
MKADTEFLQDELNRIILDSLLEFIRKSASTFQRGTDDWASGMRANEIPTAALVRVNVPNHEIKITFQSSSDQLQQSVTPFVVSIQAKECAALKHLMQRVLERLMGACVSVDVEEEEEPKQHSTNVNQKRVHCSLGTLCDCRYGEQFPLMFVFDITTSPSTIQHMLPQSISFLLCIELFQSLSCTQHLTTVIDKVGL